MSSHGKENSTAVFLKDTFEIDDYLSKCTQKSDLVTLRNDLKHHGKEVYEDMIEILKSETDNIVSLAEDLTNLNAKINNLTMPVAQLKQEIQGLYLAVSNSEVGFKHQLDTAHVLADKRNFLKIRVGILSSLTYIKNIIKSWDKDQDITVLERAVSEYSFHYLYSHELNLKETIKEDIFINIAGELIALINLVFSKALKSNNNQIILRCLSMYANLNKQNEAEKFVKETIVRPFLSKIFTQSYLHEHNNNMQTLYTEAHTFLNTDLGNLRFVLNRNPDVKGFNFVINSFWTEVDKQLCENLPNITAPGNPEFFQARYQHTREFLEKILAAVTTSNLFTIDPSFEAHMKRFNLPVYFEIRFQQIAAKFETELLIEPSHFEEAMVLTNSPFKLNISATLWACIQRCLDKDVYLVQLSDQLFKLIMLLVSRYTIWYETSVKWPATADDPVCHRLEKFVMYTMMDIVVFKKLNGSFGNLFDTFDNSVFKIVPPAIQPTFTDIRTINNNMLDNLVKELQEGIVNFKIQQCVVLLQQVSSIPRIYRRTNRSIPSECNTYVIETTLLLTDFYNAYSGKIEERTLLILDLVVAGVGDRYLELVREVLKSVCKTEESLKRLKNRNSFANDDVVGQTRSESISDEAKIREQIKLDVGYFVKEVQRFSKYTSKPSLAKLLKESGVIHN